MSYVEPYMREALFKGASRSDWIGRVQAVTLTRECVPMVVAGMQCMLEFSLPDHWRLSGNFEQMQSTTMDGEIFLPMLEHRRIALSIVDHESGQDDATPICFLDILPFSEEAMAVMLRQGFILYFRTHPQVAQYFYDAGVVFARFLRERVLDSAESFLPSSTLIPLSEVAAPRYGFTILRSIGERHE